MVFSDGESHKQSLVESPQVHEEFKLAHLVVFRLAILDGSAGVGA